MEDDFAKPRRNRVEASPNVALGEIGHPEISWPIEKTPNPLGGLLLVNSYKMQRNKDAMRLETRSLARPKEDCFFFFRTKAIEKAERWSADVAEHELIFSLGVTIRRGQEGGPI